MCGGHTNGVLVFRSEPPEYNNCMHAERTVWFRYGNVCDYKYWQLLIIRLNEIVVRWFRFNCMATGVCVWKVLIILCTLKCDGLGSMRVQCQREVAYQFPLTIELLRDIADGFFFDVWCSPIYLVRDCIRTPFLYHRPSHRTANILGVVGFEIFGPISPMPIILFASSIYRLKNWNDECRHRSTTTWYRESCGLKENKGAVCMGGRMLGCISVWPMMCVWVCECGCVCWLLRGLQPYLVSLPSIVYSVSDNTE